VINPTEATTKVKEVRKKEQHNKKRQLLRTLKPHRGHTVFEYNTVTGKLSKAAFDEISADFSNPDSKRKSITVNKDCIYLSALNRKNAFKKLYRYLEVKSKTATINKIENAKNRENKENNSL